MFNPIELVHIIEAISNETSLGSDYIILIVEPYLDHENSYVREAAILALYKHHTPEIIEKLKRMLNDDPSPGVRSVAEDVLDGILGEKP
jgi:HEAT repeat protein